MERECFYLLCPNYNIMQSNSQKHGMLLQIHDVVDTLTLTFWKGSMHQEPIRVSIRPRRKEESYCIEKLRVLQSILLLALAC